MTNIEEVELKDNVSLMREIRDKISEETKDMTYKEFKEYLNNQNTDFNYSLNEPKLEYN